MVDDVVLNKLINYYHNSKLAHAYLIETNNPEKCFQDVLYVVKNIACPSKFKNNCEECNLCYLIDSNLLPSLITIEPDGASIKKEQILELKKSFSSMPVFSNNNIYIIKSAEKLNASAANTMLKFLEEPESNIIGFFITNNINNMIPTIESRCELLRLYYSDSALDLNTVYDDADNRELITVVIDYLNKIEVEKKYSIMYNRDVLLNKFTEKEDIVKLFQIILAIYNNALSGNFDYKIYDNLKFIKELSFEELRIRVNLIMSFLEDINCNVNKELLLDKFVIELSDIHE